MSRDRTSLGGVSRLPRRALSWPIAGMLIVLFGAISCGILSPEERFIIRVDSIAAPDTIGLGDTLNLEFFGTIGPNGCYKLGSVDRHVTSGTLGITFHGKQVDGNCTQMFQLLDYPEEIAPPLMDPFVITVEEPNGNPLVKTVRIR